MTEKEGKIINAGELPCTLKLTRMLLLLRSLENCKSVDTVLLCIYYEQKAQKLFAKFFTCNLDTVGSFEIRMSRGHDVHKLDMGLELCTSGTGC